MTALKKSLKINILLTDSPFSSPGFTASPSPNGLEWCFQSSHHRFKSYSDLAEWVDFPIGGVALDMVHQKGLLDPIGSQYVRAISVPIYICIRPHVENQI